MSQFDAAAMPMFASFGVKAVATPFNVIPPQVDLNEKNTKNSIGTKESSKMDFSGVDRAPNEIIWKSVKGKDSIMPPPLHQFRPITDPSEASRG